MLLNPFTPSDVAALPDEFFGRAVELHALRSSLPLGSVLIQGPISIGKSSLLARVLDEMAAEASDAKVVVADREIESADALARVLLDSLLEPTNSSRYRLKFGLKFGGVVEPNVEVESRELDRDIKDGRHLAALKRLLENDYRRRRAANRRYLLLAIDEADKAPAPVARLVRSVWTHCQQVGVRDIRFALAGVSPLHQDILSEDPGVERAFNRVLTLAPMSADETHELLVTKFKLVTADADQRGIPLSIHPTVVDRIVAISGGHPHVVQLLGSHVVEQESSDPDGTLDVNDLLGVLQRVCYEDRKATYAATLHKLEGAGMLDTFSSLLSFPIAKPGFPTRIDREYVSSSVKQKDIQWLIEHDILVARSDREYGLVDEFLRIRIALDREAPESRDEVEAALLRQGRLLSLDELRQYGPEDDEPEDPDDDSIS